MTNELAVSTQPKASDQLASFLGIEKGMMIETLKAQCFKSKRPEEVTDAQLASFISTANVLQVNPLVPGMLYAYPEKNGGITPILGPDGVFKKLDEMITGGKLAGYECEVICDEAGKPIKSEAIIYRNGDAKPAKFTAWFSEWFVASNPNWNSRPKHQLWIRGIKQCARQVIHGLPMDPDEYAIAQMTNVTESAEDKPEVKRVDPPARRGSVKKAEAENAAPTDPVVETPTASTGSKADTKFNGPTVDAEIVDEAAEKAKAAEAEAKKKAEAAALAAKNAAPDLSKVPEVAEGVSYQGFKGKAWPVLITASIVSVKTVDGVTPHHKITVNTNRPAEATFDVIMLRKVSKDDKGALVIEPTPNFIKPDSVIEFNASAKFKPLPKVDAAKNPLPENLEADGKTPKPDLTKAPFIIAANVTEAQLADEI